MKTIAVSIMFVPAVVESELARDTINILRNITKNFKVALQNQEQTEDYCNLCT